MGHLPCLRHGRCTGHLNVHHLGDALPVATNDQRECLAGFCQEQQEPTEGNRTFFDRAVLSHAVRQAQDGIVGARVSINRDAIK